MGRLPAFDQLTRRGQDRRLRLLAMQALTHYDLQVIDLRLVGNSTNTLFRLRTPDRGSFILQVCRPGWRTDTDLLSAVAWLQALRRDTDIPVPQPLAARHGQFLVSAQVAGVPEPRRCLVTSWLPGTLLGRHLTEANLEEMGALFARLHAHAAKFHPPCDFTQRRMDSLYPRGEDDVLFGELYRDAFSLDIRAVLERTRERVCAAFARLYADPNGLRVIHNDLWHGNIKLYRGRLQPFDFEDTLWGYPVQDIAMAFQDLSSAVPPADYPGLCRAFRRGYSRLADWPEGYSGQIDEFRAGRMLWVCNYVARFERAYLRQHLEWVAPQFEAWLEGAWKIQWDG